MEFDDKFKELLTQNKEVQDSRILKLDCPIPQKYETAMDQFLEKFFGSDPFDIKSQDLETLVTPNGKIKKLKFDRSPSTFLSLLRFLELYRQQFKSIKSDLSILANFYKRFESNELTDTLHTGIKDQIFTNMQSAGKLLNKWKPQVEQLFQLAVANINFIFSESESTLGAGKGFVNLRKVYSEGYLNLTFKPYYENTVNFCIMCMAFSANLKTSTAQFSKQAVNA